MQRKVAIPKGPYVACSRRKTRDTRLPGEDELPRAAKKLAQLSGYRKSDSVATFPAVGNL